MLMFFLPLRVRMGVDSASDPHLSPLPEGEDANAKTDLRICLLSLIF